MNDASGENVEEHVDAADGGRKLPKGMDDQAHMDPSRWWFVSSAFPMIAGTLGPVASAFSICALVKPWRQEYPPGSDVDTAPYIPDPVWLTALNAVQLFIALVANASLLLNMTRRLRFSIAQPITIIGWYMSFIILLALTSMAAGPLDIEPKELYIWSQSYFYAVYSAALYFLVASLMAITFWGAHTDHYEKDFMLTPSQRTLMLQTIMFILYLLIGALLFSKIEEWGYLDGIYWAAVTLFTVGFGDYYPTTTLGRSLLFPYALIGIISLGLVIGSIRSLMLERGKHRLDARMVEKKRRKMLKRLTMKGHDHVLIPIHGSETRASSVSLGNELTEIERREEEFKLMRKIQEEAANRRRWVAMSVSTSTWLVLWLVGAKVFQIFERPYQQWTYFDAFYLSFVSLTTIGYGDMTPVSNGGKSFWVFWALLALPTMTVLISNAGDTIVKFIRDATDSIATITILPGERGFRKDLKQFFKMVSFGQLFKNADIGESEPGLFGAGPHLNRNSDNEDEEKNVEGTRGQDDQGELDAEGANTAGGRRKRADQAEDEKAHAEKMQANVDSENKGLQKSKKGADTPTDPNNNSRNNSDSPATARNSKSSITRTGTIPGKARTQWPTIPADKAAYHVVLIEEIQRVTQHLKHHPPRKYTYQEWAWYLRLIGEDEADAERHRRAHGHRGSHGYQYQVAQEQQRPGGNLLANFKKGATKAVGRKGAASGGSRGGDTCDVDCEKRGQSSSNRNSNAEKEGAEWEGKWSWVGSRSPLMGSQEEAEWILERLTEKLADELKREAAANGVKKVNRREDSSGEGSE